MTSRAFLSIQSPFPHHNQTSITVFRSNVDLRDGILCILSIMGTKLFDNASLGWIMAYCYQLDRGWIGGKVLLMNKMNNH